MKQDVPSNATLMSFHDGAYCRTGQRIKALRAIKAAKISTITTGATHQACFRTQPFIHSSESALHLTPGILSPLIDAVMNPVPASSPKPAS